MIRRFLRLAALAALLPFSLFAYDDGDLHNWTDLYVVYRIDDQFAVRVEEELMFGDDVSDLYYYHTDVGLIFKANPNVDLSLNYRHIDTKSNRGAEWTEENRPHGNVTFKGKLGDFQVEQRNRFEFRVRDNRDDIWRYRSRVLLAHPLTLGGVACTPYVSEEAFIDTDLGDFNQFRTAAGVKKKFGDHVMADVYYLWQTAESSTEWTDTHFIGLALGYTL